MYISRDQYNRLIRHFPVFMTTVWPKLDKSWKLPGCYVSVLNPAGPMAELIHCLDALKRWRHAMRVKISDLHLNSVLMLRTLTDACGLADHVTWEEGHEGDDLTGPFIVITFAKFQDRAREAFRHWDWCEIIED